MLIAFIPMAMAAYSLASSLLNRKKNSGGQSAADAAGQRFDTAVDSLGSRANTLNSAYDEGMLNFDPYSAYRTAAQGAFGDFSRTLNLEMQKLRGAEVGAGRIDTGFGTEDEDRTVTELGSRLNDTLAQGALTANAQNLSRLGMIGQTGQGLQDDILDAYFGRYATEKQAQGQASAGRNALIGNIGGALINAGGTYLANRYGKR